MDTSLLSLSFHQLNRIQEDLALFPCLKSTLHSENWLLSKWLMSINFLQQLDDLVHVNVQLFLVWEHHTPLGEICSCCWYGDWYCNEKIYLNWYVIADAKLVACENVHDWWSLFWIACQILPLPVVCLKLSMTSDL